MTEHLSLTVVLDGKNRRIVSVSEETVLSSFLIGRATEADLSPSDLSMSQHHCRIFRQAQSIMLEDLWKPGWYLPKRTEGEPTR